MAQEVMDGDKAAGSNEIVAFLHFHFGKGGDEFGEWRCEVEQALLDHSHDGNRDNRLGHGINAENIVHPQGGCGVGWITQANGLAVLDLSPLGDERDHPRHAPAFNIACQAGGDGVKAVGGEYRG